MAIGPRAPSRQPEPFKPLDSWPPGSRPQDEKVRRTPAASAVRHEDVHAPKAARPAVSSADLAAKPMRREPPLPVAVEPKASPHGAAGAGSIAGRTITTLPAPTMALTSPLPTADQRRFSLTQMFGGDISQYVADAVILALDKYEIRTLEDLANDDRLQVVATYACDFLPASVRFIINRTLGRAAFETYIFDFLIYARGRVPREQRAIDLRATVREVARTPWLSDHLSALYAKSRSGLTSMVAEGTESAGAWMTRLASAASASVASASAALTGSIPAASSAAGLLPPPPVTLPPLHVSRPLPQEGLS
jgi:hypothetical protein